MPRKTNRRSAALGAAVGMGVTVALVLGLGVFATSTDAAPPSRPENTSPPTISGTPREGQRLTGNRGEWSGNPTDYNFFWDRCAANGGSCAAISGATSNTYTLRRVDVGNTIRFRVQATNSAGSTFASSVPTAVIAPAAQPPPPPPATGCPSGTGPIPVTSLSPPARLLLDAQQSNPGVVTRGTEQVILRYRVTACGGRPVQGALVYATAVPFNQLSIPPEQPTGGDGWAQLDLRTLQGFPVSSRQQLIAIFVRARKAGENLLGGVSTRRLFSVRVD
jgi:hypothetical protein